MMSIDESTAAESQATLKLDEKVSPPKLPNSWSAVALLTPYGQKDSATTNYNQLVVAEISYNSFDGIKFMAVGLYLLEELKYFKFEFFTRNGTTYWYWLKSQPGQPPTRTLGPFAAGQNLVVPNLDFLSGKAQYTGQWPILNQGMAHWVVPTHTTEEGQNYGSWFSSLNSTSLSRIINIPADNGMGIPILGAYFMVNLADFRSTSLAQGQMDRMNAILAGEGVETPDYSNPMVTQADINRALTAPLFSAPCTLAQIQSVIPGIEPTPNWPLPEWSDKVQISGYTLGENMLPYVTNVYYWASHQCQRSEFVGWGPTPQQEGYNYRQDTVLYSDYFHNIQYEYDGDWKPLSGYTVPGIGYPRPNFLERMGAKVRGSITGNPGFGLDAGETLYMTLAEMPRSDTIVSSFWDWWREDQTGVIFTESELSTPPQHDLSVIDYVQFVRNANITAADFPDPCNEGLSCPTAGDRSQKTGLTRT